MQKCKDEVKDLKEKLLKEDNLDEKLKEEIQQHIDEIE